MYGSYLVGRLVKRADIPASSIDSLAVFVEMNKKPDHVKMWKAGLEAGHAELNGAKTTSKTPRPAEERDLVVKTSMGWANKWSSAAPWLWALCSRDNAQLGVFTTPGCSLFFHTKNSVFATTRKGLTDNGGGASSRKEEGAAQTLLPEPSGASGKGLLRRARPRVRVHTDWCAAGGGGAGQHSATCM